MINLQVSGVCLYNREIIIELTPTDLPEPVVPAINKWGIVLKSTMIGFPAMSFPKQSGNFWFEFWNSLSSKICLNVTISLSLFGNSIPIVLLPGIVDILADSELVFLAISSERFIILETFLYF